MAGVHGKMMYGTCDVVPELFYVGTFFFHINFVPLIPLGSHLILSKNGDPIRPSKSACTCGQSSWHGCGRLHC